MLDSLPTETLIEVLKQSLHFADLVAVASASSILHQKLRKYMTKKIIGFFNGHNPESNQSLKYFSFFCSDGTFLNGEDDWSYDERRNMYTMGLLSLADTIELFHQTESIINLPMDKLKKLYESMFDTPLDENVSNSSNDNDFDENFDPDNYDMDVDLEDNKSIDNTNDNDIDYERGTSVAFYYNKERPDPYTYLIKTNEVDPSKEQLSRMRMLREITMNNSAIKQLRHKIENYFEKKSPLGVMFESYGSIIQMTGTRPTVTINISPHGLFYGHYECGHYLGIDHTYFYAQLNIKSVISFFKDLRQLLLPFKDSKATMTNKEMEEEFMTCRALYPKMEKFSVAVTELNPNKNFEVMKNIKALLLNLTKRPPEEHFRIKLKPTLSSSYLNHKFHMISEILISHMEYSPILKMDLEAWRFIVSTNYPKHILLISALQAIFDEYYREHENYWKTKPEQNKSWTTIYVSLMGTEPHELDARVRLHPESNAFKEFEAKLLEFKETNRNSVRLIDDDADDYSL